MVLYSITPNEEDLMEKIIAVKKPIEIECMIYDGECSSGDAIVKWSNGRISWMHSTGKHYRDPILFCHTLEGDMRITKNDYVIRGVRKEFYPCKPDIFDETYQILRKEKIN